MLASLTSSTSSVGSSISASISCRRRFGLPGGSLEREAQDWLDDIDDEYEAGGPCAAPDCSLAESIDGVVEVCGFLGSGSFSEVWDCMVHGRAEHVAVKVFKPDYDRQMARECQLHAESKHPNLVQLFQVTEGPPCAIFMELCPGGTLSQLMHGRVWRKAFRRLTIRARLQAAREVVSCVAYLHASRILHRDVKASNCLLSSSPEEHMERIPQVKLSDLGLARHEAQTMSQRVGTLLYMAPELMEGDDYSFPVDVYSCGMLIYELVTGVVPFSTSDRRLQNYVAFVLSVPMGERPSLNALPRSPIGREIRDIIARSWDAEPASRPSAEMLASRLGEILLAPEEKPASGGIMFIRPAILFKCYSLR